MENLVPLGTGNSRLMKSNIPSNTTLAQLIQMWNNGTFPYDIGPLNSAGISQQGTPLNKATLLKDATAALYGLGTDAVPDDVLKVLSQAALYKTVTPTAQLGTLAEGSIIYLNENGQPVPFYVAKQGYEPSYNTDRVLVVRKDVYNQLQWNRSDVNTWATSTIHSWLNSTYKTLLDSNIQEAIATTTYRYTPGNGNWTVTTRSDTVFLLSLTELGQSPSYAKVEGSTLPIASTLKIAYQGGSATDQWTRSPNTSSTINSWAVSSNGNVNNAACNASLGSRPAFTLPSTFIVTTGDPTTGLYDLSNNLLLTLPGVQIETGSYTGTGTYGASNPNSLTFGFVPKFVIIYARIYNGSSTAQKKYLSSPCFLVFSYKTQGSFDLGFRWTDSGQVHNLYKITFSGNSISWYSNDSAAAQANVSGSDNTYYYLAIG